MAKKVLVLSDIDGTLVDHPFLSGANLAARRSNVERMFSLFSYPNFGLVTGRRKVGFERFFSEYDIPYQLPAFLGVEFATHHAVRGRWVVERKHSHSIALLMDKISRAVVADLDFGRGHDVLQALRLGKIETYFLEEKTLCAQIEAHFPNAALQKRFFSIVEEIVNPAVAGSGNVVLQGFASMGRMDILERGFIPKAGFWETIDSHREEMQLCADSELTVVALGDELYDSYMFQYLRNEIGARFSRVYTISVGKSLLHATHFCSDTNRALGVVERILKCDEVNGSILNDLEVVL